MTRLLLLRYACSDDMPHLQYIANLHDTLCAAHGVDSYPSHTLKGSRTVRSPKHVLLPRLCRSRSSGMRRTPGRAGRRRGTRPHGRWRRECGKQALIILGSRFERYTPARCKCVAAEHTDNASTVCYCLVGNLVSGHPGSGLSSPSRSWWGARITCAAEGHAAATGLRDRTLRTVCFSGGLYHGPSLVVDL